MDELNFVNGSYKTPDAPVGFFSKLCPSCIFYLHLLKVVFRGSAKARKGKYPTAEWIRSSLATVRALEQVGVQIEVSGVESFKAVDGPCVFIGNHMSTLETFVLPCIIGPWKDVTFVVKHSLVEYPVFKHIMRSRNPIVVGRENAREDLTLVLTRGAELLKNGVSLIIFPQTTRTSVFDAAQFNTIGIKLAKRADVPIVPIALKTDAWGAGRWLKDFGRIDPMRRAYFAFGNPIRITGRGSDEHQSTIEFIEQHLKSWGGQSTTAASTPH